MVPRRSTPTSMAWLLDSDEPWTRYRTRLDLLGESESSAGVRADRRAMLRHPLVRQLITQAATWPGRSLTRHNDAAHPIYALSTLADYGIRYDDRGMSKAVKAILAHQSKEGALQTLVNIPKAFGGSGKDSWTWIACDAPTLAYSLLSFGLSNDPRVIASAKQTASLAEENGWRCRAAPELGRLKGPGKRGDPCPMANVYALKVLSLLPGGSRQRAAKRGVEALLRLYAARGTRRPFLFGIGSDFHKLRYPFVWYATSPKY